MCQYIYKKKKCLNIGTYEFKDVTKVFKYVNKNFNKVSKKIFSKNNFELLDNN